MRDAVDAAGGLAQGADTSSMNLALPLGDGQKVHVPFEGEAAGAEADTNDGDAAGSVTGAVISVSMVPMRCSSARRSTLV